jgi:hypothetical protein
VKGDKIIDFPFPESKITIFLKRITNQPLFIPLKGMKN